MTKMANIGTKEYPFVDLGRFESINCKDMPNKKSVCTVKFSEGNMIIIETDLKKLTEHYNAINI